VKVDHVHGKDAVPGRASDIAEVHVGMEEIATEMYEAFTWMIVLMSS